MNVVVGECSVETVRKVSFLLVFLPHCFVSQLYKLYR